MTQRMPRPEEVSRHHIDGTEFGFLKGERDADRTEVALVTLHPWEKIRLVLKEHADRNRTLNGSRFREIVRRLRFQRRDTSRLQVATAEPTRRASDAAAPTLGHEP